MIGGALLVPVLLGIERERDVPAPRHRSPASPQEAPGYRDAMLTKLLALVGAAVVALGLGVLVWLWWDSRLPETYNVMGYGTLDYGGGRVPALPVPHGDNSHDHTAKHLVSVAQLRGPAGRPDRRFTLTARHGTVRLASGRTADALTFDGRVPGPELRVREGDLVEVTLVNKDVTQGVTIHWHGVDVPNAEDGVAGVTQDAVPPGGRYVYRFRAEQAGTFWYHTHQSSAKQVRRGLFGAFVIEPRAASSGVLDLTLVAHDVGGRPAFNAVDGVERRAVRAGTPVRLRLVNSENTPQTFTVAGTPFRVVAVDGTDLNAPAPLRGSSLKLRRRRPLRHRVHHARDAGRARHRRHGDGSRAQHGRTCRTSAHALRPGARPDGLRQARRRRPSTSRAASTGSSASTSDASRASGTAAPACSGRSTAASSPTSPSSSSSAATSSR